VTVGHLTRGLQSAFEREMHERPGRLIASASARVNDVGAAEGYHSVGLSLRLIGAAINAFDLDKHWLARLEAIAAIGEFRRGP
jgi:hypothetical protein